MDYLALRIVVMIPLKVVTLLLPSNHRGVRCLHGCGGHWVGILEEDGGCGRHQLLRII